MNPVVQGSRAHPCPIQWVSGVFAPGVKRPGREADHLPPSVEVKKSWRYTSTSQYVFMLWCLVKHRDNFTSTYTSSCKIP
jgi:hypothetical protein